MGKGQTARALAVEVARAGLVVDVVDMDLGQATLHEWALDRAAAGLTPAVNVRLAHTLVDALDGVPSGTDVVISTAPPVPTRPPWRWRAALTCWCSPRAPRWTTCALRYGPSTVSSLMDPAIRLLMALSRIGSASEAAAAREYLTAAGYAVADGFVPERISYRAAHNAGHAITEVRHPNLRSAALTVIQSVINAAVGPATPRRPRDDGCRRIRPEGAWPSGRAAHRRQSADRRPPTTGRRFPAGWGQLPPRRPRAR